MKSKNWVGCIAGCVAKQQGGSERGKLWCVNACGCGGGGEEGVRLAERDQGSATHTQVPSRLLRRRRASLGDRARGADLAPRRQAAQAQPRVA
jgi:uncharacterized protein YcfJ